MKRTIYVDLDGVIVDFDTHFFNVHGVNTSTLKSDNVAFWKLFDTKRDGFFRDAPAFPGYLGFMKSIEILAETYGYKVEMLTALPRRSTHPTARQEKQDWMNDHGLYDIKMNVGPYAVDKQKWCNEGDILIDDTAINIEQWRGVGGVAIHHKNFETSLIELRTAMQQEVSYI
jgi:5'-nucleotidase